ncbi:MAG: DNA polymerase III subunit beta [Spirochaetales bacterium]|nr:DNA polymerase III subunit beta [Candidatus Physcosoma equi]
MKFICSCQSIRQEIEYAINFSSQKNSLSIASNVLLENNNDILTVKATDGKMGFQSTISVSTVIPGSTTVFCDKLVAVLKNMPEGNLEFNEENGKLTIRPVDSNTNININMKTMESSRYPELMSCPDVLYFSLPQKEFNEMVDKTSFAVSEETTRFFLTGVYMEKKNDKLVMVATDGRRLAYIGKEFEQEVPDFTPVIIPVKFLSQVKALSTNEGVFSIAIEGENIYAKIGSRSIYSALIGGQYPNYERVIPKEFKYECKMRVDDMENAISLISVLIESKSKRIFIDLNMEGVMVSGENTDYGDSKQIIPCEYEGPAAKISFNCGLLLPVVKKIESDYFKISYNTPAAAMVLTPEPEKDYLYVLMPMQV